MNKKILVITIAFMIVAILATPLAVAKPGAEKNNPKFLDFVLHVEYAKASDTYPSEWKLNPPSLMDEMGEPPYNLNAIPEEANVLFVKNRIWQLPPLPFPAERYVTIGNERIDLDPSDPNDLAQSDFYCVYDVTWIYEADFGVYNLETTLTIDSGEYAGIIEISSTEKTTVNYDTDLMIGKGTFVGHGVINGQNVKLVGERNVLIDLTFVLPPTMEEKGTIQFLGKAT